MMMRRTPMNRTGFKALVKLDGNQGNEQPEYGSIAIKNVAAMVRKSVISPPANDRVFSIPKDNPMQSEAYMRLVRLLPCAMCGIEGYTQFCHADQGKGMGIKSDCRLGWPGCGPHHDTQGCHYLVGTSGVLIRDERRELERRMGELTRAKILDLGLWPKGLPPWPDDVHPP